MKRNLTPGTKTVKRKSLPLLTAAGAPAGCELAVPASFAPGEKFRLGPVQLQFFANSVRALDSIPASWFVDLSEGVQDLSDGA